MEQVQRDVVIHAFSFGWTQILITTDNLLPEEQLVKQSVAVINFELPLLLETYIQRIARGVRPGQRRVSVNLVSTGEMLTLRAIENYHKMEIQEMPSHRTRRLPLENSDEVSGKFEDMGLRDELVRGIVAYG